MGGSIFAVFKKDGGNTRVAFQDAGEFGAAIAAISDDSCEGGHCGYLFTTMHKYTTGAGW